MFSHQVGAVDGVPDPLGLRDGLVVAEAGVLGEVGVRVAEGRLAQPQEPLDVPVADLVAARVDVHAEVEEVAQGQPAAAVVAHPCGLQDVEALDDHDVGPLDDHLLAGDHVVGQVGVDRRLHLVLARLDVDREAQQRAAVVGLREPLALQQAAALELGVRVEEAVGGHQRDVGVLRPVREHLLQHARGGRLADRDRAGQADDERRARWLDLVEELLLLAVEQARGLDVQAQQLRQRQVDLLHLVEVELVAETAQPPDLVRGERVLHLVGERGPRRAVQLEVGR